MRATIASLCLLLIVPSAAMANEIYGVVRAPEGPVKNLMFSVVGVGTCKTTDTGQFQIGVPQDNVGRRLSVSLQSDDWSLANESTSFLVPAESLHDPVIISVRRQCKTCSVTTNEDFVADRSVTIAREFGRQHKELATQLERKTQELTTARQELASQVKAGAETSAELDKVKQRNEELLAVDTRLREEVDADVDRAVKYEHLLIVLRNPDARKDLDEYLLDQESARVHDIRDEESFCTKDACELRFVGALVSDRATGYGGGAVGYGLDGLRLMLSSSESFGLAFKTATQLVLGDVSIKDLHSFYLAISGDFGPNARFGLRNAFTIGLNFAPDLFVVEHKNIRFPLVGASADIGYQRGLVKFCLMYKRTFTDIIYPSEPNLTALGAYVVFFAPKYAESRRRR